MARKSTTRYAIMALLTIQPMSGYDIRRALESIGGFWFESDGQIYPTLKKLAEDGLTKKTVEHTAGKPNRNIHALTDKGRDLVTAWLREPAIPTRLRDELLFKLFFGGLLSLDDSKKQIKHYKQRMEKDLAFYSQLYEKAGELLKGSPDTPFRLMTIRFGIMSSQSALDWCNESLQVLNELENSGSTPKENN